MGVFKRADDPKQGFLLPPSPRDWLPEGHLAWFILETVDQLNIDALVEKYRVCGKGELPYPPRTMLRVLIYAYATGTTSSRRIAALIEENLAFRVLAGGLTPSHRTICRFREDHTEQFQDLFHQVVKIAVEAGMVKMGVVAIDGSKVKANASKHKAMSYDRMQVEEGRLREEIKKLTRAAKKQDEIEDADFGPNFRGDELPEELSRRKTRLEKIVAAKKRLEERKAKEAEAKQEAAAAAAAAAAATTESAKPAPKPASEAPAAEAAPSDRKAKVKAKPEPRDQENFTDSDSRIMPTGGKSFEQCYNAQVAVDAAKQIIVGNLVCQSANDNGQLIPTLNEAFERTGMMPKRVLADAGYKNEADLKLLAAMDIDAYVATGREGKATAKPKREQPCTGAMRKKLATKHGRKMYARRKGMVEPVFGWVKRVLGFRTFSLRGLRKVAGEWNLVCLALNLRRMAVTGAR